MATGLIERYLTYHYKHRDLALVTFADNTRRILGKQLMDGRVYTVVCGGEFTVLEMARPCFQETVVQRALVTLRDYEAAEVSEYVDFNALVATDRQLGVVVPKPHGLGDEHWIFGIEYFDLGPGKGTVKCWRRIK